MKRWELEENTGLTRGNRRDNLTKSERKTQAEIDRGKSKTWHMRRELQNQTGYNSTKNSNHDNSIL